MDVRAMPVPVVESDDRWRVRSVGGGVGVADWSGGSLAALFVEGETLVRRLEGRLVDVGGAGVVVERDARLAGAGDDEGEVVDVYARRSDAGFVVALVEVGLRVSLRGELERLRDALEDAERQRSRMDAVQRELARPSEAPEIIGRSAPIVRLIDEIGRVASGPSTVLVHGESGSGKELIARAIHSRSPRAARALVAVNCAAMPDTLLESELFGHERGAFTGAEQQRLGKFELADGGTLFLDEIAELSAAAQAKLLRVLQDGTLIRVGGSETIQTDVRLVAATHRDLAEQVRKGRFREDLFYRLNVFRLTVPPLRERKDDIKPLAEFFHGRHARRMAKGVLPISERSMRRLLGYRWPGNVRELENTIERATLLARESDVELDVEIPEGAGLGDDRRSGARGGGRDTSEVPRDVLLDLTLEQLQRLQIMHALETTGYKVFGAGGAAEKLEIHPQTLLSRMDKLGIPRPRTARRARSGG